MLAAHEFQEAFKNYRDLLFLSSNLDEWHDKLGVFDDMLATRRKAFAERLPQVPRAAARRSASTRCSKRRDAHRRRDRARRGRRRRRRLRRREASSSCWRASTGVARRSPTAPDADAELAEARDRLRLVARRAGLAAAQEQTDRAWDAKKELAAHRGRARRRAERRDAELARRQRDEPARFDDFARAHRRAQRRCSSVLIPRVAALGREQQRAVQDIAIAELERQQERLAVYTTQARFALAQLYDRAYGKKEGDHAARPSRSLALARVVARGMLALPACCLFGGRRSGTPDNEPTLKTLASARSTVDKDQARRRSTRPRRSTPTASSSTSRRRRRSAPKRCAASATSRWTAPTTQSGRTAGAATGAPDYKAAIARYQDFLKTYPNDPDNDRVLYQLARA